MHTPSGEIHDSGEKQMPRSSHGRVLTQSKRLRQATDSPPAQVTQPNIQSFSNKNYILCHVRRVQGKTEEPDDDKEQLSQTKKN